MPALLPDEVKVLKIHVPDFVLIEELDTEALDPDWHESDGWRHCRPIGDAWLATHRCAFLKVPSAARLGHFNYLGNPHARGWDDVTITEVIAQPFPAFVTEP
jgi:RES domain-containing protein